MAQTEGSHISPWVHTMRAPDVGSSNLADVNADVLVIGGGITGITTALLLQESGKSVAVIDAGRIGESVTTHSTVKVTYGHGLLYSSIEAKHGTEAAAAYAQANVAGFQKILELADEHHIDCILERERPHAIYAEGPQQAGDVEQEAEVARRIGLPVTLDLEAPLPFGTGPVLTYKDQAQFHPGQYLTGLTEAFVSAGGTVLEGIRAEGVDEDEDICHVETSAGPVSAQHVVVATHSPFLDRGGQFARMKAQRSYGVAGVLPQGRTAGMATSAGSPGYSTRTAQLGGEELLIVVGQSHEVGHVTETAQRWDHLRQWATDHFGIDQFRYYWSAEELSSLDHLPFVGFIAPRSHRILTATGFDGWGMTNGTGAAILMKDLILGHDNPWASVFDARRATKSIPGKEFLTHNAHVGKTLIKDRVIGGPKGSPEDLQPGQARVLQADGEQTAAYRDDDGTLHCVSAVCTHMGCNVQWNDGERTWDCPCHGSRFSHEGQVLHGPATKPLAQKNEARSDAP